ncbi:alpha/beta fold hydrolase [Corynebacterium sp. 4HC-13]|uniref:Alpha/beta fold hydrolase n=2 Tax=Corynebacterium anserum TaxID=2684406 RepID=A0A7G7YR44_9CORY|nr:alpha/beta fold hydrolase [Corynebacterium anserum]QNH96964.1 alpha/beta fold hydrolase [Corynebacterium anserum]
MGKDPDKQSPVRCTLVQYNPEGESDDGNFYSRPALLLVHGMTDYFFQAHVAQYFHSKGYAVYGLDMRKCGRSWREGQTWHHVTDQSLYDTDLTIASTLITNSHPTVTLFGHSTGGLDVTMWSARLRRASIDMPESSAAQLYSKLAGIVLNSPWFGLQFDAATKLVVTSIFPTLGKLSPSLRLPGGINPLYGKSLHSSQQGEWNYNLELKPLAPRPKFLPWINGVVREIRELQSGKYSTGVPTLLLCSDTHSFKKGRLTEDTYTSDVILKPSQMREYAQKANKNVEVAVIKDAVHDVFLSRPHVRAEALETTAEWLERHVKNHSVKDAH